jgi:glyoxylate reductase
MTQPTILASRRLPPNVTARLERDYDAKLNHDDELMDEATLLAAAEGCSGLLVCSSEKLTARVIGALPKSVGIVATFSVGYEHIDVEAARARGIVVTNTPDVLTEATADIAMLCLLGAARRASEGERIVREGRWVGWNTTMLLGVHLGAKRLGIVGMGRIGRAMARRARGFGMEIHYHNRRRISPELEAGAIYHDSLNDLLRVSQFLSINAPAMPETLQLLDAQRIALLPEGAVVVNTARGNMVDDDALIAALGSGKIAAAGLDVFDGEPDLDPRYRDLDNTFLLPHLGSATHETRDAMGMCCLDNFDAFFAGRACPTAL